MTQSDVPLQEKPAADFYERYEVKQELGRGLSSVVRYCIERQTNKAFACKIIEHTSSNQETKESTQNEIKILKMVGDHPNIIQIHETFEGDSFTFIVMEFCPGGELFNYLTKVVRLSEKKARHQMHCIIDAVRHLHEHNIVHRDLKPENILLDENLKVKVTDLGLAVQLEERQYLREVCGTVSYMAPEVFLNTIYPEQHPGYGKPVDMWACGVIMYTMLSGMPPFWHRKQNILLRMIMEAQYSLSNVVWDEISNAAKDLISRLLEFDISTRLTAEQALNHPWFKSEVAKREGFVARRILKAHIIVVWSIFRLKTLRGTTIPVKGIDLLDNPYRFKGYRKLVDFGAFDIYSHWVHKAENQNRAALFETELHLQHPPEMLSMTGELIPPVQG